MKFRDRVSQAFGGKCNVICGYSAAHLVMCLFGLKWRLELAGVSPIWPASGLGLYALHVCGWRVIPGLVLSKMLATTMAGYPLDVTVWTNLADPLKLVAGLWVWDQLPGAVRSTSMVRRLLTFLLLCLTVGVVGATVGSGGYLLTSHAPSFGGWFSWMIGDLLGCALVVPVLKRGREIANMLLTEVRRMLWVMGFIVVISVSTLLLFASPGVGLQIGFLVLPLLLWGGLATGLDGALLLNLVFVVGLLASLGPATAKLINFTCGFLCVGVFSSLIAAGFSEQLRMREGQRRRLLNRLSTRNRLLREREKDLHTMLDKLPDAVVIVGPRGLDYANHEALQLAGKLHGPRQLFDLAVEQTEGRPDGHSAFLSGRSLEQESVHLEVSSYGIQWGGQPRRLLIARDVTARRRTMEALLETENKFSRMFQLSPESIVLFELETHRILEVNAATEKIFGYERKEVVGRGIPELGVWVNQSDWDQLLAMLGSQAEVLSREARMRRKDGQFIHLEISARKLDLEGRGCVVAILEDITQRTRLAEEKQRLEDQLRQSQKLEALGTLAGGIAHDFNNSLTIILGNTQLAELDPQLGVPTREHLRNVLAAGSRARDLVSQIMTFSRRREQRLLHVRTAPIVAECVRMMRATIPANIELQHHDHAPQATVLGDASQLQQVLINLCTNAVHAMRPAGGTLRVDLSVVRVQAEMYPQYEDLRSGEHLRIEVRDTGHGMPGEVLRRIFEPFFTTKAAGEGTGLGLAVVHGIVRAHQGFLEVSSVPGEGSSFRVYLPLRSEQVESDASGTAAGILARGDGEAILVVDDEYAVLDMLEKLLRHLNYQPVCFSNPGAAVEAFNLRPAHYKVVLSDYKMSQLTGLEVAKRLRGLDYSRFILMTGFLDASTQTEAQQLGVHAILEKPVELSLLAGTLQTALSAKRSLAVK